MRTLGRRAALIAFLFIPIAVAVVFVWRLCPMFNNPFNDARFDRAVWLAASGTQQERNPRGPMAEDLQRRLLHKGMTRRQVEAIIGKPDFTSEHDRQRGIEGYYLGDWGWMSLDPDSLELCYDRHGQLIQARIDKG